MSLPKDILSGFSLGAVFSAATIEGGMHVLVHYFEPIANFMTHVAAVVVPGLDVAWAAVASPIINAVGLTGLFAEAAGQAGMEEFLTDPTLGF